MLLKRNQQGELERKSRAYVRGRLCECVGGGYCLSLSLCVCVCCALCVYEWVRLCVCVVCEIVCACVDDWWVLMATCVSRGARELPCVHEVWQSLCVGLFEWLGISRAEIFIMPCEESVSHSRLGACFSEFESAFFYWLSAILLEDSNSLVCPWYESATICSQYSPERNQTKHKSIRLRQSSKESDKV